MSDTSGFRDAGPQDAPRNTQYTPGPQLFDPTLFAAGAGHLADNSVMAKPGGRAEANALTGAINRIEPCATAGNAVALPPAVGGQMMAVANAGVASCQVYAADGTADTINGVAPETGVSLAPGTSALFCSSGPGVWFSVPSA